MHIRNLLLILLTLATAFSCRELPTFDPGENDPNDPNYRVRPVESFQVMRNVITMDTQLFWKADVSFPFDGSILEMGKENQFEHFKTVPASEIQRPLTDSQRGDFFILELDNIPYLNTDFRVRMFYILDGDTLFSEPDTATLNQSLFDFRTEQISDTEYILSWKNNFMENATVEIAKKTVEGNFEIIDTTALTGYLHNFTNSATINSIEEKELYFRVSDPMRSADFIPINLTKKSCIQTIGSKKFFVPDEITYSTKRIGPGREVTIDWGGNCTFDEFKVYWDHGSGRYSMYEYFLPMQEIFSTSENSGKVTFQNTYLSSPKIWWTVVIDGEETELTLPSYSSF